MSKRVLLIIGRGIAAYKSLDLIRRLKESGVSVRVVMTEAAQRFVTPLAAGAITGERVFTDLFDQAQEFDVAISGWPVNATWSWSRRRPQISWRRPRMASPMTSPRPCCSPPTGQC